MTMQELSGHMVKIGKTSITCLDENGKTCGMVTCAIHFVDLPPRDKFDTAKKINCLTIRNNHDAMQCLFSIGGKLYYIANTHLEEFCKKYPFAVGDTEKRHLKDLDTIKSEMEAAGITVISALVVK